MIQTIAFYLFSVLVIASAVMVIMSRNPVHSVLWLILAFFNAAGLMVLVGAEFIAALMVIVYVGAVAVLFLFVVMMLDIDFAELRAGFIKNFPLGIAIALVLAAELIFGIGAYQAGRIALGVASGAAAPILGESNTASIGAVLYRDYIFLFEAAGLILLVAMVGAIVLPHRKRPDGARGQQDITRQVRRNPDEATVMKQPEVGRGVEL